MRRGQRGVNPLYPFSAFPPFPPKPCLLAWTVKGLGPALGPLPPHDPSTCRGAACGASCPLTRIQGICGRLPEAPYGGLGPPPKLVVPPELARFDPQKQVPHSPIAGSDDLFIIGIVGGGTHDNLDDASEALHFLFHRAPIAGVGEAHAAAYVDGATGPAREDLGQAGREV